MDNILLLLNNSINFIFKSEHMINVESRLLAETFEKARGLSKFYISQLKNVDPHHHFELNGASLNSVAWIIAHITWSENFLMLESIGGSPADIPWLGHYEFGSDGTMHEPDLDVKELLADQKIVHTKAMDYVSNMNDAKLETENKYGLSFGDEKSVKAIIQHAIRHEASHAGQLGILCKLYGIKTV